MEHRRCIGEAARRRAAKAMPRSRGGRATALLLAAALALPTGLGLSSCSGSEGGSGAGVAMADEGTTEGPAYQVPASILTSSFDAAAAQTSAGGSIDASHAADGYVAASAQSDARLKFQVTCGDASYNYDLPNDGTPIVCPLNMGDGSYVFRIMQNTSGSNYVEVARAQADVKLASEFEPFLRPNVFCSYSDESACVEQARQLAADASNEGDVVRAVYRWVVGNISYDYDKAAELSGTAGYVPDPDRTLAEGTGICFDYASLAGAMLRSLGIPCQVVTGYVSPDALYHAWNMVYINGRWISAEFSIDPDDWTRMDLTFAAAGATETTGDGTEYTDRYIY